MAFRRQHEKSDPPQPVSVSEQIKRLERAVDELMALAGAVQGCGECVACAELAKSSMATARKILAGEKVDK